MSQSAPRLLDTGFVRPASVCYGDAHAFEQQRLERHRASEPQCFALIYARTANPGSIDGAVCIRASCASDAIGRTVAMDAAVLDEQCVVDVDHDTCIYDRQFETHAIYVYV